MSGRGESILVVRLASPVAALEGSLWLWPGADGSPEPIAAPPAQGDAGSGLIRRVEDAIDGGHGQVVVDLGSLQAMSTDEIKALTGFLWTIRVAGGTPAVASPVPAVTDALRHLKLDRAFPVQASVAAAAADLRAEPCG